MQRHHGPGRYERGSGDSHHDRGPREPQGHLWDAMKFCGTLPEFPCCLTCLETTDEQHRRDWLRCPNGCIQHGLAHDGDPCPDLFPANDAFWKKRTGMSRDQVYRRSKSGLGGRPLSRRDAKRLFRETEQRNSDQTSSHNSQLSHGFQSPYAGSPLVYPSPYGLMNTPPVPYRNPGFGYHPGFGQTMPQTIPREGHSSSRNSYTMPERDWRDGKSPDRRSGIEILEQTRKPRHEYEMAQKPVERLTDNPLEDADTPEMQALVASFRRTARVAVSLDNVASELSQELNKLHSKFEAQRDAAQHLHIQTLESKLQAQQKLIDDLQKSEQRLKRKSEETLEQHEALGQPVIKQEVD